MRVVEMLSQRPELGHVSEQDVAAAIRQAVMVDDVLYVSDCLVELIFIEVTALMQALSKLLQVMDRIRESLAVPFARIRGVGSNILQVM